MISGTPSGLTRTRFPFPMSPTHKLPHASKLQNSDQAGALGNFSSSQVDKLYWQWDAATANPDTILGWYRKLVANKFDGSRFRRRAGRPRMNEELERFVVQMAKENPGWGYDRIVGAYGRKSVRP
jgi:hypothetical protein